MQIRCRFGALISVVLLVITTGCGGGENSGETETPNTAASEQDPMLELQALPKDLEAEVAKVTKPIDDLQGVLDRIASIPERYGISITDLRAMVKGMFETGTVQVQASTEVSAEAKAEITAALVKLKETVDALKSTPSRVVVLVKRIPMIAAKAPMLASKITVEATVTASNPFGNADAKMKAKANLEKVKQVQTDVMRVIKETQAKVVGIPKMAVAALGKVSASFEGVSSSGSQVASKEPASSPEAEPVKTEVERVKTEAKNAGDGTDHKTAVAANPRQLLTVSSPYVGATSVGPVASTASTEAFTLTTNPVASDGGTPCVMGPPLTVGHEAPFAACVNDRTGPMVVTDIIVGGGCQADLFVTSVSVSNIRWAVVIPPSGSLSMHGARLVVGPKERLMIGTMAKTAKSLKSDHHCAVTWTTAPD